MANGQCVNLSKLSPGKVAVARELIQAMIRVRNEITGLNEAKSSYKGELKKAETELKSVENKLEIKKDCLTELKTSIDKIASSI